MAATDAQNPNTLTARKLLTLRRATGLDPEAFAEALDVDLEAYHQMERGEIALPTAKLPALGLVLDAPLASVVADIHGTGEQIAELYSVARAYQSITNPVHREALLGVALCLSPA
jgi:transcriptional regulator with XRE-family HTH domain